MFLREKKKKGVPERKASVRLKLMYVYHARALHLDICITCWLTKEKGKEKAETVICSISLYFRKSASIPDKVKSEGEGVWFSYKSDICLLFLQYLHI